MVSNAKAEMMTIKIKFNSMEAYVSGAPTREVSVRGREMRDDCISLSKNKRHQPPRFDFNLCRISQPGDEPDAIQRKRIKADR